MSLCPWARTLILSLLVWIGRLSSSGTITSYRSQLPVPCQQTSLTARQKWEEGERPSLLSFFPCRERPASREVTAERTTPIYIRVTAFLQTFYLSLDIICSSKLTGFLELRSRKTVRFSEQIMSADKYLSIFSRQMEATVYLYIILLMCVCVCVRPQPA